jgi:ATP-dependent DNA helicase RecQ
VDRIRHEVRSALRADAKGAVIAYVTTRLRAVHLAAALRRFGISAHPYHAGLRPAARKAIQDHFLAGSSRVVCATSAFGMGIDHPSVRLVAHLGMPGSLEGYVQESGRAGRDGLPARCVLVTTPADRDIHRALIDEQWPTARRRKVDLLGAAVRARHDTDSDPRSGRRRAMQRLGRMSAYVDTRLCRRSFICDYFGESAPVCRGCDRCGADGQR